MSKIQTEKIIKLDKGKYNDKSFRTVKHGLEEESGNCRHCKMDFFGKGCSVKARRHAEKTLHTVDVYRENWVEYTSYISHPKIKVEQGEQIK